MIEPESQPWKLTPLCCWCGSPFVQAEIHSALAWRCSTDACFDRCARWMDVIDDVLFYLPLPKQVELYEAVERQQYRKICWGGEVGGGKSKGLRHLAYRYCRQFADFTTLLLRRTYLELESSHLIPAGRDAAKLRAKYSRNRLAFDNGSLLRFGHCDDEGDYALYRSDEYDLIIFDQLETFLDRQFTEIGARTGRVRRVGWRGIVLAGENPGGPGAAFVDELFIAKNRDRKKYPHYKPEDHLFIPAAMSDNPNLAEGYEEFLGDLPDASRQMLRFGRRDIFPGQYFKDFTHPRRVQALDVPAHYPRVGAFHWGYFKSGIMLWAVVLPDGRLYIEREYVFEETIAALVALQILTATRDFFFPRHPPHDPQNAITLLQTVGNAISEPLDAAFGEDVFETLYRSGFAVIRSEHDAITGWQRLQHWFVVEGDEAPAMIIDPSCTTLLRTVPQLIQAPTDEENVDEEGATAAAKALRYLVMSRPQRHLLEPTEGKRDLSTLDDKTRSDLERLRAYEARESEQAETIARSDPGWPFGSLRDESDLDPRLW